MRLSDRDILEYMKQGKIHMNPRPTEECLGSFSIDVRLSHRFRIFNRSSLPFLDLSDPGKVKAAIEQDTRELVLADGESFYLQPGELALGMTIEHIRLADDIVGWLDGRSSLARLGLMVHITAHSIDPGWEGHLTFEFYNAGQLTLALHSGLRIGAISFEQLSSPTTRPYGRKAGAKYHGQEGPLASQIALDR